MKAVSLIAFLALVLISIACAKEAPGQTRSVETPLARGPEPVQDKPAWQVEWERTLAEGRKEGKVNVYNTAGARVRAALIPAFKEKTGIDLELTTVSGSQAVPKILTERNAGLYLVDIYTGGGSTITNGLKPAKAIEPLGPALILPEVLDKNAWMGGDLNYTDDERQFVIAFTGNPDSGAVTLNLSIVKKEEVTSYFDLLNPKWKGKIIMLDPTQAGKGANWFHNVLVNKALDLNYMKSLAKQEPVVTRDERQLIEWVVRGKNPIGMFISNELTQEFIQMGVPVEEIRLKEDTPNVGASRGGSVVLLKNAPHPNAAKVFINWLLSKEGQYVYSKAGFVQSRRLDVPTDHLRPFDIRVPGFKYFDTQTEQYRREEPKYMEIAKEIFGPLIGQ